jgi:hypothetical protein
VLAPQFDTQQGQHMHYGNFNQERSGAATEDLHAWEAAGADSAEALSAWVGARLAAHEAALAALLAVEGVARRPAY